MLQYHTSLSADFPYSCSKISGEEGKDTCDDVEACFPRDNFSVEEVDLSRDSTPLTREKRVQEAENIYAIVSPPRYEQPEREIETTFFHFQVSKHLLETLKNDPIFSPFPIFQLNFPQHSFPSNIYSITSKKSFFWIAFSAFEMTSNGKDIRPKCCDFMHFPKGLLSKFETSALFLPLSPSLSEIFHVPILIVPPHFPESHQ